MSMPTSMPTSISTSIQNLLNFKFQQQKYSEYFKQTRLNECKIQNTVLILSNCEIEFMKWMDEIEHIVFKSKNVYLLDIPDQNYMVMFEGGHSAKSVATHIIKDKYLFF